MDNKVYSPQVVPDTAFPQQIISSAAISDSSVNQTYTPATIQETPTPNPIIARETISQTLNTKQRKILQEFQFTQSGSLQIGEYTPGVSGDVRLSPEGIIARDLSGQTTFALDGDSGDAVFAGTVTAAGFEVIDSLGLNSLNNFPNDFYSDDSLITNSGNTFIDVAGSDKAFTLDRETHVFIAFFAYVIITTVNKNVLYSVDVAVSIDGVEASPFGSASLQLFTSDFAMQQGANISGGRLYSLGQGTHKIKLRWRGNGVQDVNMGSRNLNYIIFGK